MSSTNQCSTSSKCCCTGSKWAMFFLSLVFTVSAAVVVGGLLAFPTGLFVNFFMPEVFGSFAQAFRCLTPSYALVFLTLSLVCRLVHVSLKGGAYFKETYFYEYLTD